MIAASWLVYPLIFVGLLAAMVLLAVGRAWRHRTQLGPAGQLIGFGQYLRLRWRGVDASAILAAHWATQGVGRPVSLDEWMSFATLGVNVTRLASAMQAADQAGLQASFGALGAAALAGYDPVEVVRAAAARGLVAVTTQEFDQFEQWGLVRGRNSNIQ